MSFYGSRYGSTRADTRKTWLNGPKLHLFWHSSVKFLLSDKRERFHIKMLCFVARQYRYFIFLFCFVSGQILNNFVEEKWPRRQSCGVRNTQETRDKTLFWSSFSKRHKKSIESVTTSQVKPKRQQSNTFFAFVIKNYFNRKFCSQIGILCK